MDQFSNYTPSCAKRFKYLAEKMTALQPTVSPSADNSVHQLSQYVTEVQSPTFLSASAAMTALAYWKSRQTVYCKLAPVAVDILAAPASQAYVERLFSVCGLLSSGRRNRMTKSLAMRVCLKMNMKTLHSLGCL